VPPETDWAVEGSVVRPRVEHRELYDRLYARYGELYPATKDVVHDLAAIQEA